MTQHPFPMTEPDVAVTPQPDAPLKEVLRVDAGGFFVPLAVGTEVKWSFYDWPERQLTNVSHTRVAGTIKYRGQECLEILDSVIWGDDAGWLGRWLYRMSEESLRIVLFESRDSKGTSKIEEVDSTPEPLRLKTGLAWTGHEVYRCGSEERGVGEAHHGMVDGPFEVSLPTGKMLCLRENWSSFKPDGAGHIMAELYVAKNGRSVFFRRFNGPAWHNYDQLTTTPVRDHAGVTWRLWYECIPDISLAV